MTYPVKVSWLDGGCPFGLSPNSSEVYWLVVKHASDSVYYYMSNQFDTEMQMDENAFVYPYIMPELTKEQARELADILDKQVESLRLASKKEQGEPK